MSVPQAPPEIEDEDEEQDCDNLAIFELISRVRNRPLLFDSEHENHKDRFLQLKAWEEVADGLFVAGKGVDGYNADICFNLIDFK